MSRFELIDGVVIQDRTNQDAAWNLTPVKTLLRPSPNGEGISYLRKEEKNGIISYNWQIFLPPAQNVNQPSYSAKEQDEFYELARQGLRHAKVGQIFKELAISYPIAPPQENWKKAEELFDFMSSKNALGGL